MLISLIENSLFSIYLLDHLVSIFFFRMKKISSFLRNPYMICSFLCVAFKILLCDDVCEVHLYAFYSAHTVYVFRSVSFHFVYTHYIYAQK